MPYALKEAGFYSGMALIVMVAMCSDYTVRLIVSLGQKAKRKYYEDLCASQFGHGGYVFVVGAMGIFAYGAAVAYLLGIGEFGAKPHGKTKETGNQTSCLWGGREETPTPKVQQSAFSDPFRRTY
jgi:hypothetical protein